MAITCCGPVIRTWRPLASYGVPCSRSPISLFLFKPIFPVLATHDLAGSLVSVIAGVGAVHQVHAALSEWGVRRAPRFVLTLLFGINPMVLYYAGNGMSDMLYMFLLVMTTRYFLRWIHGGGLRPLVYAGSALGLAYLDRYEAIGAAGMAGLVVLVVSYWRSEGQVKARIIGASADATIFLAPLVATFMSWAVMSYVITGQAFPGSLRSTGRAPDIRGRDDDVCPTGRPRHPQPRIPCPAAAHRARPGDLSLLLDDATFGSLPRWPFWVGVSLSTPWAFSTDFSSPWYRYFIVSIPLDVMLAGCILAQGSTVRTSDSAFDPDLSIPVFGQMATNEGIGGRLHRSRHGGCSPRSVHCVVW